MNRNETLALVVLLAIASLPVVSAAASVDVTVSGVDVRPSEPVPGDEVAIEPTIENFDSSVAGYFVDRVRVVEAGGDDPDEFADVKDIGTIPVGGSKTVPLSATFEDPGTYDLRVRVSGRETENDQRTQLSYPLTITVEDRQPQLDVNANDSAVGVRTGGTVTVANSLGSSIEDVELTVDGADVTITNSRSVLASVASNASRSVAFWLTASERR